MYQWRLLTLNPLFFDFVIVEQTEEDFYATLKELVSLMTNHYLGTITRNAIIQWCENCKDAPFNLILSLLKQSCSAKMLPYISAPLIETLIRLCFQFPGM